MADRRRARWLDPAHGAVGLHLAKGLLQVRRVRPHVAALIGHGVVHVVGGALERVRRVGLGAGGESCVVAAAAAGAQQQGGQGTQGEVSALHRHWDVSSLDGKGSGKGEAGAPCCHQGNRPGPHGVLTTDVVQLGADFGRVFSSHHWRLPQSGRWLGSRKIGREGAVALSQKAFESRMNTGKIRVFEDQLETFVPTRARACAALDSV